MSAGVITGSVFLFGVSTYCIFPFQGKTFYYPINQKAKIINPTKETVEKPYLEKACFCEVVC